MYSADTLFYKLLFFSVEIRKISLNVWKMSLPPVSENCRQAPMPSMQCPRATAPLQARRGSATKTPILYCKPYTCNIQSTCVYSRRCYRLAYSRSSQTIVIDQWRRLDLGDRNTKGHSKNSLKLHAPTVAKPTKEAQPCSPVLKPECRKCVCTLDATNTICEL